jgi:hypothetical protein
MNDMKQKAQSEIRGHKTIRDANGFRHEPLSQAEAFDLLARVEAEDKRREELMPDENAAIKMMFDAWLRLKELGWIEACYCPKDGTVFDAIEPGSTGIHSTHYSGVWPNGRWYVYDGGDLYPSRPILFKLREDNNATNIRK